MAKLEAVSLFSNCGAGDVAFAWVGFRFQVLAEIDEQRLHVALRNHPDAVSIVGDLRETWPSVVASYQERCGSPLQAPMSTCPPCDTGTIAGAGVPGAWPWR